MKAHFVITLATLGLGAGCSTEAPVGEHTERHDGDAWPVVFDAKAMGVTVTGGAVGSKADADNGQGPSRCSWQGVDGGCVGTLYSSAPVALDIFIMFDESGSMATKDDGTTMRIDAVRGALAQFLAAPESAGLGVGIGYFGVEPLTCACTSCNPDNYARPAVAVGELPGQGAALLASLQAAAPTGETPTGAALRGAAAYARQVAAARAGHEVVVLLVTDGEPQAPRTSPQGTCTPTLADAVAAAREGTQGIPSIRTFVLGVGPSLQNLHQIASAGGSGQAYLVESGGGAEILQALDRIRSDASIPCALQLPETGGAALDLRTVNVVYADDGCAMTSVGMVQSAAACNAELGGWYFDPPTQPTAIRLCETSCNRVTAPGTELRISVGCQTQVIP